MFIGPAFFKEAGPINIYSRCDEVFAMYKKKGGSLSSLFIGLAVTDLLCFRLQTVFAYDRCVAVGNAPVIDVVDATSRSRFSQG